MAADRKAELMEATNPHELITHDRGILGGIPVFTSTRVPVQTLIDYLEKGHSLDAFLDDFPTVERGQAQRVIAMLGKKLAEELEQAAA